MFLRLLTKKSIDLAFGGSWADADVDMASISVPIEKGSFHDGDGFNQHHLGDPVISGPPYIIKLLNLPVTANDSFVQDLFQSRFTPYVKFKIVTDPASNILETHVIRQVAFVELESASDMSKALKWHDLYYKANRRVTVEVADFNDFQNCIKFNQEHEREIMQIQQEFIAQKQQQRQPRHMALLDEFERNQRGPGSPLHQNHDHHNPHPQQQQHHHFNPNLNRPSGRSSLPIDETSHSRRLSFEAQLHPHQQTHGQRIRQPSFDNAFPDTPHPPFGGGGMRQQIHPTNQPAVPSSAPALKPFVTPISSASTSSRPKSNPFGAAKPVDTLSKQQEIEKKLINLNKTTVQTLGDVETPEEVQATIKKFHENGSPKLRRASVGTPRRLSSEKRPSVSILRRDLPERQQPPPPPQQQQQQQQPPQQQDQNTKQTALHQPDQLQNHSSNVSLTQPSGESPLAETQSLSTNPYTSNGTGKSLAQLLSEQSDIMSAPPITGKKTPRSNSNTKKSVVAAKPVILKKKTPTSPPVQRIDLTIKESEYLKKQDETDDLIDANVETKLEKLDLNSETLLENGTKESTKTRIDNPKRENDQHDDRPNFKNLDQLVQKRNDSRASSSSSNSRRFEFIRGLKEENERVPSPSSSSSYSYATKTSQNNSEKSLESAISRTDDQQDWSSNNTGPEGRMWERGRGRGRGRGGFSFRSRGGFRGRGAGFRGSGRGGPRGRGGNGASGAGGTASGSTGSANYNLHYVRSKPTPVETNE